MKVSEVLQEFPSVGDDTNQVSFSQMSKYIWMTRSIVARVRMMLMVLLLMALMLYTVLTSLTLRED